MNPTNPTNPPDPASSYGREKPDKESGMGRLTNNHATPAEHPDKMHQAVKNSQEPRQINSEQDPSARTKKNLSRPQEQPDHSMLDEEPNDWDLAPQDIKDPRQKRHPRTEGKGGTP